MKRSDITIGDEYATHYLNTMRTEPCPTSPPLTP
jgi:hypothetical protein